MSIFNNEIVTCPDALLHKAAGISPAVTAVINPTSTLSLEGVRLAIEHDLIKPILIGDLAKMEHTAGLLDWDIRSIKQVEAKSEEEAAAIATNLAKNDKVSMLMKGDIHTNKLLKSVLDKDNELTTGNRLSHLFYLSFPDSNQTLAITDAVINVLPDVPTKLDIVRNTSHLMHALGYEEPKVAVLSATEKPDKAIPSSIEAAELVKLATKAIKGIQIGGPFALDNAISEQAARIKGVKHPVAGRADVLLVPNIETGNALFKQMVYGNSACAAGIVLGATLPIALTSRADPPAARLASVALAAIYANQVKDD